MKKRILSFILSLNFLLIPFSNIFASENYLNPRDYGVEYLDQNTEIIKIETRSIGSKFVRKAISLILKNKKNASRVVRLLAGARYANQFEKAFETVAPQLRALLNWTDIPYQAVYDAVYRGCIASGLSKASAIKIAYAIKEGISWIL